jgi:hypothetical protein
MNTDERGYLDALTERVLGAVFNSSSIERAAAARLRKWLSAG